MNHLTTLSPERRRELLQERFARRVAAALDEREAAQPRHDIAERLRVAREQALARRPRQAAAAAPSVLATGGGTVALGGSGGGSTPWWLRLSALAPLALLVAGLMLIDARYTRSQIEAAAEVDAAILADDLPPEAYSDPGFVEYLKRGR